MLFIDLDETLVRTVLRGSSRPRDQVVTDLEPDFSVRLSGATYDVYLRPDLYYLWWAKTPFVLFSAGDRQYVHRIARKLRDDVKLNIRGWLYRYNMSDVGPSYPITEEESILIDERHYTDPIVRYKLERLPNSYHLRVDPWDTDERTKELGIYRAPLSRPFRLVLEKAHTMLGLDQQVPRMIKAVLRLPFADY